MAGIASYLPSGVSATALVQIAGNVALSFPIGVQIPLVVGRDPGLRTLLLIGSAASVGIELVQWRSALGVASVDDVLLNVTGVVLGYLVYRRLIAGRWACSTSRTMPSNLRLATGAGRTPAQLWAA